MNNLLTLDATKLSRFQSKDKSETLSSNMSVSCPTNTKIEIISNNYIFIKIYKADTINMTQTSI